MEDGYRPKGSGDSGTTGESVVESVVEFSTGPDDLGGAVYSSSNSCFLRSVSAETTLEDGATKDLGAEVVTPFKASLGGEGGSSTPYELPGL